MDAIYSEADLAEKLNATERRISEWRRIYSWPCVRIGRTVRFTQVQFEQIIAKHSQDGSTKPAAVELAGQTERSAKRAS